MIEALETGCVYRGHFNVVNNGVISNLPDDAVIEAPGYVDRNGISMPLVGDLPLGPAAVCNGSISVQRLAVEAAVRGDDKLLRQAFVMDPLVGAVCNPKEIWQMVDEMLVAQEAWLPQYGEAIAAAKKRLAEGPLLPTREGYRGGGQAAGQNRRGNAGRPQGGEPERGRIGQRPGPRESARALNGFALKLWGAAAGPCLWRRRKAGRLRRPHGSPGSAMLGGKNGQGPLTSRA